MLAAVGLVALVLVGEEIVEAWRAAALVRSLQEGELREAFVRAERAWRNAKGRAA